MIKKNLLIFKEYFKLGATFVVPFLCSFIFVVLFHEYGDFSSQNIYQKYGYLTLVWISCVWLLFVCQSTHIQKKH
tara:strand:- start:4089 stop:4313 length:225 start_codon:yes stop_codon:yes gene_type:complete